MALRYFLVIALSIFITTSKVYGYKSQTDSRLTVKVDKRIELYFITAFISESFFKKWLTIHDAKYAKDMESYFADYTSHPAVKLFEETWKPDMSTYIPPEVMIYLSDELSEQKGLNITQDIIDHMGGVDIKDEFISQIRDFAKVTNFNEFYSQHQDYYDELKSKMLDLIGGENCIHRLHEFYGTEQNHYYAMIVPLLGVGNGYGPSIPGENGKSDVYCLFSPYQDDEQLINLLWHEFGHSFVNPIVANNSDLVNQRNDLFAPIESSMKPVYADWEEALSEHLVRANTAYLVKTEFGKSLAKKHLKGHEIQGFAYINLFTELIDHYMGKRNKFATYTSYFPEILDELEGVDANDYNLKRDNVFEGPINAVSEEVRYIIIPTNEVNDSIEERIEKYTVHVQKFLQERSNSITRIMYDQEALTSDISDGDVFVYGTINGNLWLKAHADKFPFIIESDRITADKVYEGTDLRFISAWPHFQNKNKGIVIYTAQTADLIWGINGIRHGGTDYIIIDHDKPESSGDYKKNGINWRF